MDPKAKINILVEELEEETLVYDLDRHRAHCLNTTAVFLLRAADGKRSVAELARLTTEEVNAPVSEDVVFLGLERLGKANLMEWDGPTGTPEGMTRRQAVRRLATVGILLPSVMTLVSPLPAQGATSIAINDCSAATVGRCCTNGKFCALSKQGNYTCGGARC